MININTVYETVLTILNKEQRGYLDSEEFNNLARLAQREIYEGYFLKFMAAPNQGPVVADPKMFIDEKISYLETVEDIEETGESFFPYPLDFYRLGTVLNKDNGVVIDSVGHKEAAYIRLSPLTAPTEKQPIFVIQDGGIQVYPNDDANAVTDITMVYIREPQDPSWGFNEDAFIEDGDILYDPTESTNFELHPSEQHELIIKICAYAGVVVRAPDVTQFAQQVEGKLTQTEE